MSTEEKKETNTGGEDKGSMREDSKGSETNAQPIKEEKPKRNNSKQTGMPFGFDELFFKLDHHITE
jgi:hypothetical protein